MIKELNSRRIRGGGGGTPTWPPFLCLGTLTWPPWRHVKTLYITETSFQIIVIPVSWNLLIYCKLIPDRGFTEYMYAGWNKNELNKYMLFTGWEVRIGKNCARGFEYLRPRAQFFSIRTDLRRWITYLFFLHFFSENEHGKLVCKKFSYELLYYINL